MKGGVGSSLSNAPGRYAPLLLAISVLVVGLLGPMAATAQARPLVLQPGKTLTELFGYTPEYVQNVPAFDTLNRPYFRSRESSQDITGFVQTLTDGVWQQYDFLSALTRDIPGFVGTRNAAGWETDRIVFGLDGAAYTALTVDLANGQQMHVLLRSADRCRTWTAHPLPFGELPSLVHGLDIGDFAHEQQVGFNEILGPPFMAFWRHLADAPGQWAARHELYVTQPRWVDGKLEVPPPILVSSKFSGMCQVAGGASFAVSRAGLTYFVWSETVGAKATTGSPVYVAVYNSRTHRVSCKRLLGYSSPRNDPHCTAGIVLDKDDYLHVVLGSHGQAFKYVRSLRPHSVGGGWTKPTKVLRKGYKTVLTDNDGVGRQTYVSLVCDPAGTLHLAYRQWRCGVDKFFGGRAYGALCVQNRPSGGVWSRAYPQVIAPQRGYVNFYHKLSIDRRGRLYLSLSCWTGESDMDLTRQTSSTRYRSRMVLTSTDGVIWRLATTQDFATGVITP